MIKTVVIDAGHGGKDPGAVGKKSKEKDIALSIALMTGKYIENNFPDVKVVYTRKTDVFIELHRRAKIANESNADLFISIHCNASKQTEPSGTEVFVMGLDKSSANLEVAKKENASILLEDNYEDKYGGIDPKSSEAYIVFSMFQHAFLESSLSYASTLMSSFNSNVGLIDRGVKQAPFFVLWQTTMPSVLVEVGFISNSVEEEFLLKEKNQRKLAYSIYKAFTKYKGSVDGVSYDIVEFIYSNDVISKQHYIKDKNEVEVKKDTTDLSATKDLSFDNREVIFKVQVLIDREKVDTSNPRFKGLSKVGYYYHDGYYKYTIGNETGLDKAINIQSEIRKKGFLDAFVVCFKDGKRISLQEAKKILGIE